MNNLKVVDPTVNTLTVRWDPAVGNVRSYKVTYSAEGDGEQRTVGAAWPQHPHLTSSSSLCPGLMCPLCRRRCQAAPPA